MKYSPTVRYFYWEDQSPDMEWLGLLLLYIISAFLKKKRQKTVRRKIESEPDWESPPSSESQGPKLDQILEDLFSGSDDVKLEPNPEFESEKESALDELEHITEEVEEFDEKAIHSQDSDLTQIEEQIIAFDKQIYHSELSAKTDSQEGIKKFRKESLVSGLFKSPNSLRRAIVLKEILDKPLALRD